MSLPTPKVGQVIRYSYLWRSEARAGQEEGLKDRPCIVVAAQRLADGRTHVIVAPISHTAPIHSDEAQEIPSRTRRRIGLDSERQWIVLTEVNTFIWPGPDLRPLRGAGPESIVIGWLPEALCNVVNARLQERITARKVAITRRSE